MTTKRKSAAGSASRSKHLMGDLSKLLRQASGYCCHHAPQHGPHLPHVVELKFADMREATDCYHLLCEIRDARRTPKAGAEVRREAT
jgi:hypothetical protein